MEVHVCLHILPCLQYGGDYIHVICILHFQLHAQCFGYIMIITAPSPPLLLARYMREVSWDLFAAQLNTLCTILSVLSLASSPVLIPHSYCCLQYEQQQ